VDIWDAASGHPLGQPLAGLMGAVKAVALGRAGDLDIIVSGSEDRTPQIWNAATRRSVQVVDLVGPASAVVAAPESLVVAVGSVYAGYLWVRRTDP